MNTMSPKSKHPSAEETERSSERCCDWLMFNGQRVSDHKALRTLYVAKVRVWILLLWPELKMFFSFFFTYKWRQYNYKISALRNELSYLKINLSKSSGCVCRLLHFDVVTRREFVSLNGCKKMMFSLELQRLQMMSENARLATRHQLLVAKTENMVAIY